MIRPDFRSRMAGKTATRSRPLKTYDESLNFLRTSLDRPGSQYRSKRPVNLEKKSSEDYVASNALRVRGNSSSTEVNFEAVIAHEHAISPALNGRTVFDDKPGGRFFVGKGGHQQRLF
jgi:hypothetical protein